MSFLLLRPLAKYRSSCEKFARAGLSAIGAALIETRPEKDAWLRFSSLTSPAVKPSKVIVTSTAAAELIRQENKAWPSDIQFFAIGASTGEILLEADFKPIIPKTASSEGLLELPELQEVKGHNIIIAKGVGGRKTLTEVLNKRGAVVHEWQLYKRQILPKPIYTQQWHPSEIHCIIATSGELIEAAFAMMDKDWLKSMAWIVVSQRTADIATKLGVKQITISPEANDAALINCAART